MSNKEKLIASAQKNLQKGQIAKAVKDYQKLVEIDPKDMRTRQRLAELYSRSRMTEEALGEYRVVAKYYSENGFYPKAIAVYKQMQKLDPGEIDIYHQLAELNEKQGLVGNALLEYRTLVTHYEKNEMFSEGAEVLGKMKELDPENLNIRVKISECYARGGLKEKAKEEFRDVLELLTEKGDLGRILKLYEIFMPLFPEDLEMKAGLATVLIRQGEVEKGLQLLKNLLKEAPEESAIQEKLAWGYGEAGDHENARLTYQHLLKHRPDDLELREGFLHACFAAGEARRALEVLLEWKEDFLEAGREAALETFYRRLRQDLPEDDPDVLALGVGVAEEVDSSAPSLEPPPVEELSVPAEEFPGPDSLVEELGASEEVGEIPSSPELTPSEEVSEEGEVGGEIPLEFLETVELPAEEPTEMEEREPQQTSAEEQGEEVELEVELDLELELEPTVAEEIPAEVAAEEEAEPAEEPAVLLEEGLEEESAAPEEAAVAAEEAEEELDLGEVLRAEEPVAAAEEPGPDLEEAEFYLQQGLLEEAERIYRVLLEQDPECTEAADKLREIEVRRAELAEEDASGAEGFVDFSADSLEKELREEAEAEGDSFSLDGFFSDSQQGIKTEIEIDDAESHYNLGIAYKEMGLLDDAVAEFDKAGRNADRRVACLILKGVCLVEKGAFEAAEEVFKAGLDLPDLDDGERTSLSFEMGLLYEAWNRPLEALESFQSVDEADHFYRGVGEKIVALRQRLGLEEEGKGDPGAAKGKKDRISFV